MASVFTIVQDESVFFPIWHNHYSKHFHPNEIFVLNHRLPADNPRREAWEAFIHDHAKKHGYSLIDLDHEASFDHSWLTGTIRQFQTKLLEEFGWTLFAEVDEIILTHPSTGLSLKKFACNKLKNQNFCVCEGYEVVHSIESESPLDLNKPILSQRDWWYYSKLYSKPLLSKIPLHWHWGFHTCDEAPVPYHQADPELLLIHLHKMDWNICLSRHIANAARKWQDGKFGFQNRLVAENKLRQWWGLNIDEASAKADLVKIPEILKEVI